MYGLWGYKKVSMRETGESRIMGYNDKTLREEEINKIQLHTDNNKFYVSEKEGEQHE